MAQLAIRLHKHLQVGDRSIGTSMGAVATLCRLTDETGAPPEPEPSIDVVVPANDRGPARNVTVPLGRWLIEATLPSGEIIAEQVDVTSPSFPAPVVLVMAEHSPQERLGWQHLLGNVEGAAAPGAIEERVRLGTKAWIDAALGQRAVPGLIDRMADVVADAASWVRKLLPSTTRDAEAVETAAAPVVQLVTFDADLAEGADGWTAVLAGDASGALQSPTRVAPHTWVCELERERARAPGEVEADVDLLPRQYLQVTSGDELYVVALPLPWPTPDGEPAAPVQVMMRQPPGEQYLQIGIVVADPTFGPLSGFMTAATLSKARVAVEEKWSLLFDKPRNPLAAAAAGYILLAAGGSTKLDWQAWIEDLEGRFPTLPDAAVLRGVLLLRAARQPADNDKAREALVQALNRGIPYFSLGISLLLDGLTLFSDHPAVRSRHEKVQRLAKRLDLSQAFTVIRVGRGARTEASGAAVSEPGSIKGRQTAMDDHETSATPTTFTAPDLAPESTARLGLTDFVTRILAELSRLKDEREAYYEARRRENAVWANGSRKLMATIGAAALLFTGLAATLRFAPTAWGFDGWDRVAFVAVLALYALMGALSFYEKGTDRTSAYFRHLVLILSIRDLWTKLQFELLKELSALRASTDPNAAEIVTRQRIQTLAEAFCNDLNKASTTELAEWRTEFVTSLSELAQAAQKGTEDVTKQIQEVVKAAEKAAADAEAARVKAEAAAKAAETAAQPGYLNITLGWDFDGEAVALIDDVEVARSHGKALTVGPVAPGFKKLVVRAQKGDKKLEASKTIKVEAGLRELSFPA